ncbi:hypothetical protein SAMN05216462_1751 [Xylanibacter ruminicola]|uniref:Abi-like protein n=1 Tax=Xylanibacter ruminicola TaxID=839 RepID=A0A1H4C3E6_XYLRU|nr:hypothetical protein [Xylanibacter ruminicola]SEA54931.1 hypothetical protein SAMN05216462_1751 [Xylanibacter ruminicola]
MPYSQPKSHITFILKPATDIVKEAVWSLNASSGGIEVYPLCSYLLHSLFLKLTGAQEQKLKCICWEIACRDFDYRYERLERNRYSECSDYNDKNMVYNDLIDEIRKHDESFTITDALKDEILADWRVSTQYMFENSLMSKCFKKKWDDYQSIISGVNRKWIMNGKQLLTNKDNLTAAERIPTCGLALKELFVRFVYAERNRCAHNTRSYQHNLPSMKGMMEEKYKLQNYFLFMSVLLLLDKIYVKLFGIYLEKENK